MHASSLFVSLRIVRFVSKGKANNTDTTGKKDAATPAAAAVLRAPGAYQVFARAHFQTRLIGKGVHCMV
jgi:hypothetical protein